jgi:hypothetical protein
MNQKIKKTKQMMAMALTVIMVVSMLSALSAVNAEGPAIITLNPSTNVNLNYPENLPIGSTFNVEIHITNAENMWGYYLELNWDANVIHCTNVVIGTFQPAGGVDIVGVIKNDGPTGYVNGGITKIPTSAAVVSGEGTLATITFEVVGFGEPSTITLINTHVWGYDVGEDKPEILFTAEPLVVHNPLPPAYSPEAKISVSATGATVQSSNIIIPADVTTASITFDASTSTAGFDGENPVPITTYAWTIHSMNSKFVDVTATSQSVTLDNIVADELQVTLIVTAPLTDAPVGYVSTSTKSATYNIIQAESTGIDIYTIYGGFGPNINGGSFGPQQEVTVIVKVIDDGAPQSNKLVGLSVYDNANTEFSHATVTTDNTGIATYSFRLPTPDGTVGFGTWVVYATVDIASEIYTDTLPFCLQYLANVKDVTVDVTTVTKGTGVITFTATIENNADVSGIITFTVVDAKNTPIAVTSITLSDTDTYAFSVPISVSAFAGTATVNVNLFSDYPRVGGVPFCPQNGVDAFGIQNAAKTFYIANP